MPIFYDFWNNSCWLEYTRDEPIENIGDRYRQSLEQYFIPFKQQHEYLFENYLVNHAFMQLLPLGKKWGVFESYMMMEVQIALFKMLLVGIAAYQGTITTDIFISLVHSFTTTTEN